MTQTWRLMIGDVREQLRLLPDASVQCAVTSPPYFGLRDYGTATWDGGDPACEHRGRAKPRQDTSGSTKRFAKTRGTQAGKAQFAVHVREVCRCGARRVDQQIGLESSPWAFIDAMVDVFREVRRVLRPDGTCWLNLGDSFASGEVGRRDAGRTNDPRCGRNEKWKGQPPRRERRIGRPHGLKPKDLCLIPHRVAIALQDDGWWVRSDIVWSKPNPMPESVTDRPTKAHEYIFLLTKSERYFYDADAIRERFSESTMRQIEEGYRGDGLKDYEGAGVQNPSDVKRRIIEGYRKRISAGEAKREALGGMARTTPVGRNCRLPDDLAGRNARSVWTITTQPYPDAHFATFPEELPTRCIKAGSRPGDVVLDPFTGSGTTGDVALRLGRSFIGIELNEKYANELARPRLAAASPLFAQELVS